MSFGRMASGSRIKAVITRVTLPPKPRRQRSAGSDQATTSRSETLCRRCFDRPRFCTSVEGGLAGYPDTRLRPTARANATMVPIGHDSVSASLAPHRARGWPTGTPDASQRRPGDHGIHRRSDVRLVGGPNLGRIDLREISTGVHRRYGRYPRGAREALRSKVPRSCVEVSRRKADSPAGI